MKRETQNSGVFTRRALMVGGVQVAALGALAARLYQVQVVEGERYATLADSNRISARLLAPQVPLARAGTALEVAQAIVWLLSDQSSYSTGALLDVSGGR